MRFMVVLTFAIVECVIFTSKELLAIVRTVNYASNNMIIIVRGYPNASVNTISSYFTYS
jgi:hypothetical protein